MFRIKKRLAPISNISKPKPNIQNIKDEKKEPFDSHFYFKNIRNNRLKHLSQK